MGINFNGLSVGSAIADPEEGVIMVEDSTGARVDFTNSGVNAGQQQLIAAYNNLFVRRRVAWIKLRFYPRYSEFPTQVDGTGDIVAAQNVPLYEVTDMDALETAWHAITKPAILANNTGIKTHLANKMFKTFRRSAKYPIFPKYMPVKGYNGPTQTEQYAVAGQWNDAGNLTTVQGGENGHIAYYADFDGQAFAPGIEMYEVRFEIKFQWADRRAVTT